MVAFLITLALLGFFLMWILAWQRGSKLAVGIAIGAAVTLLFGGPLLRGVLALNHVPLWAPPLPFALIAITLFGFGLLAWFWSEE